MLKMALSTNEEEKYTHIVDKAVAFSLVDILYSRQLEEISTSSPGSHVYFQGKEPTYLTSRQDLLVIIINLKIQFVFPLNLI